VFIIYGMTLLMLTAAVRLSFRWVAERGIRSRSTGRPALLYGAGDGGALVVRELWNNPEHSLHPVAFVDDDRSKLQKRVLGVPVLGGIRELRELISAHQIEVVVITTPKLTSVRLQEIQGICFESGTSVVRLTLSLTKLPEIPPHM
jgi:polysaccharide biosynthesis protein EpsC